MQLDHGGVAVVCLRSKGSNHLKAFIHTPSQSGHLFKHSKFIQMKPLLFILLFSFILGESHIQAQDKEIKKVLDVLGAADTAGQKLGRIFSMVKKKKKPENENTGAKAGNTSGNQNEQPSEENPEKNTGQRQNNGAGKAASSVKSGVAGTVSATAVAVEADNYGYFYGGNAILRKGQLYGMINAKGEFTIPYGNHYIQHVSKRHAHGSGFLEFRDNSTGHTNYILNTSGKKIVNLTAIDANLGRVVSYDPEYLCVVHDQLRYILILDTAGKTRKLEITFEQMPDEMHLSNGLLLLQKVWPPANGKPSYSKLGLKNLSGTWVVEPQYDYIAPFSDGLAVVGKRDTYGELKYGYINPKGEVIIPLKYSVQPGNFRDGIAIIKPPINSPSELEYAAINKKGEIIYEVKKMAYKYPNPGAGLVSISNWWKGFLIGGSTVIDPSGKLLDMKQFLDLHGLLEFSDPTPYLRHTTSLDNAHTLSSIVHGYDSDFLLFQKSKPNSSPLHGIYVHSTRKVVPPVFYLINGFDPVSRLAYAEIKVREGQDYKTIQDGYINEDGVFVIVKQKKSDW